MVMEGRASGLVSKWASLRLAPRLWWAAAASVTTASVIALAAIALFGTSTVAGSASGSASNSGSTPVPMATGSSSAASSRASSMGPMEASASQVCPNVPNATTMPDGMVMAPVPTGPPTAAQQAAANQLVAQTTSALTQYANLSAATAAGYVPATNPSGYVVHYADWQTVRSGDVLDPGHPSALVYANTISGPVLLGAMYMGPGPCQPGPDVGGSLTQWHAHDNLCLSATHQVVGRTTASGTCVSGVHNTSTYFMLHVWIAPSLASGHQFEPDLTSAEIAPIIRSGRA
jgi:hypothetical protein